MRTDLASSTDIDISIPVDADLVAQIKGGIDLSDRSEIVNFGDKAQRDVAAFADQILAQTRNDEMGDTGTLLLDVIERARGLDPAELQSRGLLSRFFGSAEGKLRRFVGQFEDVAGQIERIIIDLERHKDNLRRDISLLDGLYEETRRSIRFLEAHIQAGQSFAEEFEHGKLARLKEAASTSGDGVMAAQDYSDAAQALDRLHKRIFYLQQARQVGIQQLPQIRIVQAGDETLIENLQATTQLTIPVWKQKMVLLLGLNRQSRALEMQKTVTDATGEMMRQASAMMKTQAVEIEQQAQRGIVDLSALEKTNRDLIETVNGVIDAQRNGRAKRAEAECRMDQLTVDLRTALTRGPA